jgi:CheY-like chemotaxis protein
MLGRVIGEDIRLITNLDPALGSIKADPGQLEQVLLNLAVNARDAMPNGGKLVIETNNVAVDEEYAASHPLLQPGVYVVLTVSDTGEGISDDIREHIFEPFFTTKVAGKGTGLGLPVVHSVVTHSGGHIEVESKPGKGASFSIYLPRAKQQEQSAAHSPAVESAPSGVECILLVEDEPALRGLGQLILEECGYTVLKAANAEEALEVCGNHPSPLQLLVTDVVLPGLNGRQLAEQLLELYPQLKVLYVSGYMDDDVVRRGIAQQGVAFLQKPYSRIALTQKVREVLDAKS